MNIIVKPHRSTSCYCRPDTTWERENRDFYVPDHANGLKWAPILFARISKAGKHIGQKFVARYFDAVGFGILIYGPEDEIAFSSCLDHTSILPTPLYNPAVLTEVKNRFEVVCDSGMSAKYSVEGFDELIEKTICSASERVSLRIGDMVAVELDNVKHLVGRHEGECVIRGVFCENRLFEFKIIF